MGSIANENNETPTPLLISGFTVTVVKKELVAAALPVQEHWLPQSNLDLLVLPLDVGVFFCYSTAPAGGRDAAVAGLKNGLAQVLVSYYALAGEVVMSSSGEPELLCNNRGVEFSEAYADVELRELDLYKPDESVGGKLVPRKKDGVLAVQRRVDELDGSSLGQVAGWAHEFLERGANREHFVELIDWVEVHRPEPTMPEIVGIGSAEGPALVVSSGRGFPVSRVDFGWGPPTFGSYHFPWGSTAGYVMPMPSPNGEGDWMVYMYMLKEQLELIEREAASVFRPFTWDYVV
ncbi:unnamed protein product [Linum tenue]|uniref:Uncharacterized protein n=1 Tax=Linum tenue TaxID=586396 RepID=A0AAV0PUX7_9ROSI|nr:unnamed protein product [Linum tenue]